MRIAAIFSLAALFVASFVTSPLSAVQPAAPRTPAEEPADWVRIGFHLTPFSKGVPSATAKNQVSVAREETIHYTLRAKLNKANHFYLGAFHIQTQPLYWLRDSGRYGVAINVFKQIGKLGQVEEDLGLVKLEGILKGQSPVFILEGQATKEFQDKMGFPVVTIEAGMADGSTAQPIAKRTVPLKTGNNPPVVESL